MADVAKMIEEHLQHQLHRNPTNSEPDFADCLSISDKYEAHGMGVMIEELLTPAEMIEYQRSGGNIGMRSPGGVTCISVSYRLPCFRTPVS